jgi:DNA-binding beta-propeller fold protein YncE
MTGKIRWILQVLISNDGAKNAVTVGTQPSAVAVNPATNKIYVVDAATTGTNNVYVIDGTTNTITSAPQIGGTAYEVAVNSTTNTVMSPTTQFSR